MDLLTTLAVILLVLWLLGMVSSYTLGGFINILLVVAVVAILVRIIQGRRDLMLRSSGREQTARSSKTWLFFL